MAKRNPIPQPDLSLLDITNKPFKANNQLLDWISDDDYRQQLFDLINKQAQPKPGQLKIPSRDSAPRDDPALGPMVAHPAPDPGHKEVLLVTERAQIEAILRDDGQTYSNRPYTELGGGNFMLALDPTAAAHTAQVKEYGACFPRSRPMIHQLAFRSCRAAVITALRAPEIDVAAFAEQAALRFCQKLYGYSMSDYLRIEAAARSGYLALVYQVLGRHFTTDPTAIPLAKAAAGALMTRTSALIEAYANDDQDALKGTRDDDLPKGLKPVLKMLGTSDGQLNGEQRAVLAVGTIVGTVGNVQAAACIAVKALFKSLGAAAGQPGALWQKALALAANPKDKTTARTRDYAGWRDLIAPLLAANPPIPFLPRVKLSGPSGPVEVLLALGGGTAQRTTQDDDPLIWGLYDQPNPARGGNGKHGCLGKELAWPLVIEIVRHVMSLHGVAEKLDPNNGQVIGLKKRWGFNCTSYPLTHRHERSRVQSTLNVVMRLKAPVTDSAQRARDFIRAGAPHIEEALRRARHVHFAWFELIENETALVLHTVYDGPFDAYIQHFALKVADLFNVLFQCIEDPPPLPVDQYPADFIAHLMRYNRPPTMGYLFSAYPRSEAAQIMRDESNRP